MQPLPQELDSLLLFPTTQIVVEQELLYFGLLCWADFSVEKALDTETRTFSALPGVTKPLLQVKQRFAMRFVPGIKAVCVLVILPIFHPNTHICSTLEILMGLFQGNT